jgi:Spy/CpxP family protein refolding chaperone
MRNISILGLLLLMATIGFGQPRGTGPRDDRPMPMHDRAMQQLKLTDEQQRQFDQLRTNQQKRQIDTRAKIQSLRLDVRSQFKSDNPDRAKIESMTDQISKLQSDMKKNRIGFWFDVQKMLTPEQQKIWKERSLAMMDRGEKSGWREHGMHRGMGRGFRR